jgi:putative phosphoribosyl transferase
MTYKDRSDAGVKLAERLKEFAGREDVLLYALPRGGAVVAAEVAKALRMPFDVIVTRKIGAPHNDEFAIGALSETGEAVWNEAERSSNDARKIGENVEKEKKEAARRVKRYRQGNPLPSFEGKTVVIVDDGVATGLTMQAAIAAARHQGAARVVVAVPHGAMESLAELRRDGAEVIALEEPEWYGAVGQFYESFPQTTDDEVLALLKEYGPKP